MKRRLFNIAWSIVDQFESFAEALKHAWKVVKLASKLNSRAAVMFTYKKVDGSIRDAVGTIAAAPKYGDTNKSNHGVLRYYDILVDGWRSCKIENLIFNN